MGGLIDLIVLQAGLCKDCGYINSSIADGTIFTVFLCLQVELAAGFSSFRFHKQKTPKILPSDLNRAIYLKTTYDV